MKLKIHHPDGNTNVLLVTGKRLRIGRDADCDIRLDGDRYPTVSGIHAELSKTSNSWQLIHHSKSNKTVLNGEPIEGAAVVTIGSRFRLGFTGPEIEVVSLDADDIPIGHERGDRTSPRTSDPSNDITEFDVRNGGALGRDRDRCAFHLEHPHVSRRHALLSVSSKGIAVTDLGSANGTFVNGSMLSKTRRLTAGDVIDIGPYSLKFDGSHLRTRSRSNNVSLVVSDLSFEVANSGGGNLRLLDGINLVVQPGEFVCIIGPSGSGKSTLLHQLSGRAKPTEGNVYLNSRNLHADFQVLKQDLVVVPQSLVLHNSLTVAESFRFTAALRLPPDLAPDELKTSVQQMLATVALEERADISIRKLSGGQLKRAGLGTELMSQPSLLFLDEVTSGLDEHSDGEIMRLFRSLAESGKTVICVTHNLAHVEECCHLVAVLTAGGHLAFFGPPAVARRYFKARVLADIYQRLEAHPAEKWARHYKRTRLHDTLVRSRSILASPLVLDAGTGIVERHSSVMRQSSVLFRRTLAVWRREFHVLGAMLGQSLLVAVLLCLVFGSVIEVDASNASERIARVRNLLFLLCVSSFWLGCNNCVKELVKEREIFIRERNFNLIPEAYLLAKTVFMLSLGVVQAAMLSTITLGWTEMPGERASMVAVLCGLSISGTCLGIAISALAPSESNAVAMVPIAIIPQIILAGVVASLPTVPHLIAQISMTVFWGQKALEGLVPESSRMAGEFSPTVLSSLCAIAVHSFIYLTVAWIGIRRTR